MEIIQIISVLLIAFIGGIVGNKIVKSNKSKVSFKEAVDLTGLPIVTFKQGVFKFNLLIDTGSTKSVINTINMEVLEHTKRNEEGTIYGMDGIVSKVEYVEIPFSLNGIKYEEVFQSVDMTAAFNSLKQETGVTIHGILGNTFFEKYGYVIDFKDFIAYSK